MSKKRPSYHDDGTESGESLVGDSSSRKSSSEEFVVQEKHVVSSILGGRKSRLLIFLNVALFCISLIFFTMGYGYSLRIRRNVNNALLKETNYYCKKPPPSLFPRLGSNGVY